MTGIYKYTYWKTATLIVLLLFSTLIFPGDISSNPDDIKFEQVSIEQGLSQGTVFCIIQDETGFLWVGTQDGLNRYDGHTFKVYSHDPRNPESLSHDYVLTIFEDSKGILWLGTDGGGLNEFDRKTGEFSAHKISNGLSSNNVLAICEDQSNHNLWIGTDRGVNKFSTKEKKFTPYHADKRINSIIRDKSGRLWIGTDKGLYYYNQEINNFALFKCKNKNEPKDSIPQNMGVIYEDTDGNLWIGTDKGLYKFTRENEKISHDMNINGKLDKLNEDQISSICQDSSGRIWIGTQNNGLFIFDPEEKKLIDFQNKKYEPDSLSHNKVRSIYEDRSGLVWIGTDGGGLNKFDPKRKKFNLYRNIPGEDDSLSHDDIMAICKGKDGVIWIGTLGKGFDRFNSNAKENEKKFYHFKIPPNVSNNPNRHQVTAICEDHNGIVWLGTKKAGLYSFNPQERSFKHYKNEHIKENANIVCIYVDGESVLWICAMDDGLIRIDEDRKEFKCYKSDPGNPKSLSNDKVFSICEGNPGILWVGTAGGGINKFDKEKEQFTHYQPEAGKPDSLSHNFILSIYKDRTGTPWIGTKGGINKFDDKNETFTAYSTGDGLPSNVIYAILDDDNGNLWLSTNRGLSRFNPESKEFRNYTIRDGLQGYEFNGRVACKSDQEEMFFGGIKGLNRFFPKEISEKERKEPPPVVLTSFKMRGQESKLNYSNAKPDPLELSYKDDFISFEFAALSFSDPGKNQYAYKLEPVHKEWILLGNKHDVDLINLEPGKYTLKVKGSSSDGYWNEEGTGIKITVTPPFWQTWWFYLCLVLFVGGIVGWRISNIHKINRRLKKEIDERHLAEKNLRESEELYRKLIETSPDAIALYDSDVQNGKTVMFNQQAAVLLGYTSVEEMLAEVKNVFDIIDEKDSEKAHKSIKEIIKETAVNKNTEYTLRAKDGTPISVEINTSLIKDDDGKPRYLLSIARDISKRKEAEKKEKLNRKRLIQLERMASLGRLLSGVAHELNNPVSPIKMNSEIFDRVWKDIVPILDKYYQDKKDFSLAGLPYQDAKKRLEDLIIGSMESSQRIEKIIQYLRDFSRPAKPLTREPININKVIQSSVNKNDDLIKKSCKHFSLNLTENLPIIHGNFHKLEEVFINLIQNACQALPDNNKKISIISNYDKENKHVVITVEDGGVGIDKEDLKFITDPFFTTKREQGRTGLGLSISMQIIQDHNGNMKFQSEKGKGTTVTVSLPVID